MAQGKQHREESKPLLQEFKISRNNFCGKKRAWVYMVVMGPFMIPCHLPIFLLCACLLACHQESKCRKYSEQKVYLLQVLTGLMVWVSPHHTPQVCALKRITLFCSSFALVSLLVHKPFWTRILSLIFNRNWLD